MQPIVKTFTKDAPCTKLDIWNCFAAPSGAFAPKPVAAAHAVIGKNVPRVMERKGYLVRRTYQRQEMYELTGLGKEWLTQGFRNYLRNHPSHASEAKYLPLSMRASTAKRIVRVRPGNR